jgi:hypothetical protein
MNIIFHRTLVAFHGLIAVLALSLMSGCSEKPAAKPAPAEEIRGARIQTVAEKKALAEARSNAVPSEASAAVPAVPSAPAPVASSAASTSTATAGDVVAEIPGKLAEKKSETAVAPELLEGGFLSVGFDKLASFHFEMPAEPQTNIVATESRDQIPGTVKAFNQKRVAVQGFMLPLKVESGLVTEMLLMRDQSMCCFGAVPKINEWVSVKMTNRGVKAVMDQPVTLFGTLHVGEMRENGYLVGIYRMDGEKMAGPQEN